MIQFKPSERTSIENCPWCSGRNFVSWGTPIREFETVVCLNCELIFVKNRLNDPGLLKFYSNYHSQEHQANDILNQQRQVMYQLEFNFVKDVCRSGKVLDVGCGGGFFLDLFAQQGYQCFGIEYGKEAAEITRKKHEVVEGNFLEESIPWKFDLIIFRGVIEHVPYPLGYLNRAVSLLAPNGIVFITSTPNADSLCCDLYRENWNQHIPEAHLFHFKVKHFDQFFDSKGLKKIKETFFYEETPYANREIDVVEVARAILDRRAGKPIQNCSPAFYGNMMSILYGL